MLNLLEFIIIMFILNLIFIVYYKRTEKKPKNKQNHHYIVLLLLYLVILSVLVAYVESSDPDWILSAVIKSQEFFGVGTVFMVLPKIIDEQ